MVQNRNDTPIRYDMDVVQYDTGSETTETLRLSKIWPDDMSTLLLY